MGIMALIAVGAGHGVLVVRGLEGPVVVMAGHAGFARRSRKQTGLIGSMRIMAEGTVTIGEGWMLDLLILPVADFSMAGGAEGCSALHQQAGMRTTMGEVTVSTASIRCRHVHNSLG